MNRSNCTSQFLNMVRIELCTGDSHLFCWLYVVVCFLFPCSVTTCSNYALCWRYFWAAWTLGKLYYLTHYSAHRMTSEVKAASLSGFSLFLFPFSLSKMLLHLFQGVPKFCIRMSSEIKFRFAIILTANDKCQCIHEFQPHCVWLILFRLHCVFGNDDRRCFVFWIYFGLRKNESSHPGLHKAFEKQTATTAFNLMSLATKITFMKKWAPPKHTCLVRALQLNSVFGVEVHRMLRPNLNKQSSQ